MKTVVVKIETVMYKVIAPVITQIRFQELHPDSEMIPAGEEIMKEMAKMKDPALEKMELDYDSSEDLQRIYKM